MGGMRKGKEGIDIHPKAVANNFLAVHGCACVDRAVSLGKCRTLLTAFMSNFTQ